MALLGVEAGVVGFVRNFAGEEDTIADSFAFLGDGDGGGFSSSNSISQSSLSGATRVGFISTSSFVKVFSSSSSSSIRMRFLVWIASATIVMSTFSDDSLLIQRFVHSYIL